MAELIRLYANMNKIDECLEKVQKFLIQKNLMYKRNKTHQPCFNNLFYICKKFDKKDYLKDIFQKYQYNLDNRNIEIYKKYLTGFSFD